MGGEGSPKGGRCAPRKAGSWPGRERQGWATRPKRPAPSSVGLVGSGGDGQLARPRAQAEGGGKGRGARGVAKGNRRCRGCDWASRPAGGSLAPVCLRSRKPSHNSSFWRSKPDPPRPPATPHPGPLRGRVLDHPGTDCLLSAAGIQGFAARCPMRRSYRGEIEF